LLIEFTGLVSWRPGALIGWHTDSNKAYLTQRCAAAVVYLNESKHDFEGGDFKFRRGGLRPESEETDEETFPIRSGRNSSNDAHIEKNIAPRPGRVIAYTTSEEHCVDPEITSGERFTLSMWFTTDIKHDEDSKLLATLKELDNDVVILVEILSNVYPKDDLCMVESKNSVIDQSRVREALPVAMHALPDGVDIRLCRLACYGICVLKMLEDRWVPLRSLEAGEWDREQSLQLGVVVKSEDGVLVVLNANSSGKGGLGGGMKLAVQQVVIAVQERLLKSEEAVGCEKVCARHLNGFPDKVAPRLQGQNLWCSSCSWLDESERRRVVEGSSLAQQVAERRLENFIEAIRRYNDLEKPEEMRIWRETKESWLKVGAVF